MTTVNYQKELFTWLGYIKRLEDYGLPTAVGPWALIPDSLLRPWHMLLEYNKDEHIGRN